MSHFQPLSWLLWSATGRMLGTSPRVFHGLSLALHILNAVLLYLLMVRLGAGRTASLVADAALCPSSSAGRGGRVGQRSSLRPRDELLAALDSAVPEIPDRRLGRGLRRLASRPAHRPRIPARAPGPRRLYGKAREAKAPGASLRREDSSLRPRAGGARSRRPLAEIPRPRHLRRRRAPHARCRLAPHEPLATLVAGGSHASRSFAARPEARRRESRDRRAPAGGSDASSSGALARGSPRRRFSSSPGSFSSFPPSGSPRADSRPPPTDTATFPGSFSPSRSRRLSSARARRRSGRSSASPPFSELERIGNVTGGRTR